MVEKDVLEDKINDKKEKFDGVKDKTTEKVGKTATKAGETVGKTATKAGEKIDEKINEKREKYEERKEKGKVYSERFVNDLNTTIEELKENIRNMQKYADEKINEYKNATVSNLAVDLIEADDMYYLKVAVPGLSKEEIEIEAGDNDIVITATYEPFIEELEDIDEEDVEVIASELTVGKCSKTVRFENSIEVDKITAKYASGIVLITIPKLIIPKHKVTVE